MSETLPSVLIIDDEQLMADTLALVLNQRGFQAVACYSVADAISILTTSQPDFLVSDVVLDQAGNGIDLAIAAKQLAPNCKVTPMLRNAVTADLLEQARQSGHTFTCLAKPLHPQELLVQMSLGPAENPPRFPAALPSGRFSASGAARSEATGARPCGTNWLVNLNNKQEFNLLLIGHSLEYHAIGDVPHLFRRKNPRSPIVQLVATSQERGEADILFDAYKGPDELLEIIKRTIEKRSSAANL